MTQQVTYKCEELQHIGTGTLQGGSHVIECQACKMRLAVNTTKMSLSAHGHTAKTIKHRLISIKEIGVTEN